MNNLVDSDQRYSIQNHELPGIQNESVSFIQLKGEPYQRTLPTGEQIDCNITSNNLAENSGYNRQVGRLVDQAESELYPLFEQRGFYTIDDKLKHGQNLNFSESFSLITFVCAALNRPLHSELASRIVALGPQDTHLLQATALLSAMSAKESYAGLTSEEIAGLVAGTVHLDTFARIPAEDATIAFGGMGGDKGYPLRGEKTKLFSLSTLAAIGLAVDGPTHKHHSYPNTSKVAGQSAIEAFGARSDFHSVDAFQQVLQDTNLIMSSCHDTRTLHSLSHKLRGETINHVIGPLAYTLSADTPVQAMVGVNEKIHPERIVGAFEILNRKGFQRYDSGAVFCGTDICDLDPYLAFDRPENQAFLAEHIRLDEIALPCYSSIVAFYNEGRSRGTYVIQPQDFFPQTTLEKMNFADLEIPNTVADILEANVQALQGGNFTRTHYLAMTMGLGLFLRHALNHSDALNEDAHSVNREYMQECTDQALTILTSGAAIEKLQQYIETTGLYAGIKH